MTRLLQIKTFLNLACIQLLPMQYSAYLPILAQLLVASGLVAAILFFSHLFGQRASHSKIKDSPYECGLIAQGKAHPRFSVKFYLTAILFILLDIELVFLLPWVTIHREFLAAKLPIVGPILAFIGLLAFGLYYEFRKKALEWDQ